jgi:hypothetical protein
MKGAISIIGLMNKSENKKELQLIYNLIKTHSYFKGERRKLYSQIVKYKKKGDHK